eukprot:3242818-Rhodomonas_salina.2
MKVRPGSTLLRHLAPASPFLVDSSAVLLWPAPPHLPTSALASTPALALLFRHVRKQHCCLNISTLRFPIPERGKQQQADM